MIQGVVQSAAQGLVASKLVEAATASNRKPASELSWIAG